MTFLRLPGKSGACCRNCLASNRGTLRRLGDRGGGELDAGDALPFDPYSGRESGWHLRETAQESCRNLELFIRIASAAPENARRTIRHAPAAAANARRIVRHASTAPEKASRTARHASAALRNPIRCGRASAGGSISPSANGNYPRRAVPCGRCWCHDVVAGKAAARRPG